MVIKKMGIKILNEIEGTDLVRVEENHQISIRHKDDLSIELINEFKQCLENIKMGNIKRKIYGVTKNG
jgi:hypothetical protein